MSHATMAVIGGSVVDEARHPFDNAEPLWSKFMLAYRLAQAHRRRSAAAASRSASAASAGESHSSSTCWMRAGDSVPSS